MKQNDHDHDHDCPLLMILLPGGLSLIGIVIFFIELIKTIAASNEFY